MKRAIALFGLAAVMLATGCTRIETGEVGLRKTFNGTIETNELGGGFHQTLIGDVLIFSSREIMIPINDAKPQTLDRITMKDFDINFTYSVTPTAVGELFIKYSGSAHGHDDKNRETYVMSNFVFALMRSALYEAVSKHEALKVNDARDTIITDINRSMEKKLREEGLEKSIRISQVVIRNIEIPDSLAESANNVARAENERRAKETEVKTGKLEAERMEFLVKQSDPRYIELLKAQAQMKNAEAFNKIAEQKPVYVVVPHNFGGVMNLPK